MRGARELHHDVTVTDTYRALACAALLRCGPLDIEHRITPKCTAPGHKVSVRPRPAGAYLATVSRLSDIESSTWPKPTSWCWIPGSSPWAGPCSRPARSTAARRPPTEAMPMLREETNRAIADAPRPFGRDQRAPLSASGAGLLAATTTCLPRLQVRRR